MFHHVVTCRSKATFLNVISQFKMSQNRTDRTKLKGEQVYLRVLERSDIAVTTSWMNSEEISDIMGYLPVFSLEGQYEWFDKLKNDRTRFIFAVCTNDGRHIGNIALGNVDMLHRHAMFSIFLVADTDRAKGIGSEATRLLLGFAFDKLNLNKVHLRTSERFSEAVRMYEKLGFVREGVMRQHVFANGVYEDKVIYSMLRSEYAKWKG